MDGKDICKHMHFKYNDAKTYWEVEVKFNVFLTSVLHIGEWQGSFSGWYNPISLHYPLDRKLNCLQNRSRCSCEKENFCCFWKSNFGSQLERYLTEIDHDGVDQWLIINFLITGGYLENWTIISFARRLCTAELIHRNNLDSLYFA